MADDLEQLEEAFGRRIIDSLGRVWNPDLHPRDRLGRFVNVAKRILQMPVGTSRSLNDVVDDAPNIEVATVYRTPRGYEIRAMTRSGPIGIGITPEQFAANPQSIDNALSAANDVDPFPNFPRCPHCNAPSPSGGYLPGHDSRGGFAMDALTPDEPPEDVVPDELPSVDEREEPKLSFRQRLRNVASAFKDPEWVQDRKDAARSRNVARGEIPISVRQNFQRYRGERESVPRIPIGSVRKAIRNAMRDGKPQFIYWDFEQRAFTVQDRILYAGEDLNERGDLVLRGTVDDEGNFKTWWFTRGEAPVRRPDAKGGEERLLGELFSHQPRNMERPQGAFPRRGYLDGVKPVVLESVTAPKPTPPTRSREEATKELAELNERLQDMTNPVEGDERRELVRRMRELNNEIEGSTRAAPEINREEMQRALDEVQERLNQPVENTPEATRERQNDEVILAALKSAFDNAPDIGGLEAVQQEIANADPDQQEEMVSRLPRAVQDAIRFNAPSVAGPREDKRIAEIEDSLPDEAKEEYPRSEQELRRRRRQESREVAKGVELALQERPKGSIRGLRGLFFDEPIDEDTERERRLKIEGLQADVEEARLAVVEAQKAVNALDKNAPKNRQDGVRKKLTEANNNYIQAQDRLRHATHERTLLAETLTRNELKSEFYNVPEDDQREFVLETQESAKQALEDVRQQYRRMYKAVVGREPTEQEMNKSLRSMAQWIDRRDENGNLINVKADDPDGFAEKFVRDAYSAEWKGLAADIAGEAFVEQDEARRFLQSSSITEKGSRAGKRRGSRTSTKVWRDPNARRQMASAEQQRWTTALEPVIMREGPDGELVVEPAEYGNADGVRVTEDGFFIHVDLEARLGSDWRERYPGVSKPNQLFRKDGDSARWLLVAPPKEVRRRRANDEDIAMGRADIALGASDVADAFDDLNNQAMGEKLPDINFRELSGEALRDALQDRLDEMDERFRELIKQDPEYVLPDGERIAYARTGRVLDLFNYVDSMERGEWVVEVQPDDEDRGQLLVEVTGDKDSEGRLRSAKAPRSATRVQEFSDWAGLEKAAREIAAENDRKILKDRGADPTAGKDPLGEDSDESAHTLYDLKELFDELTAEYKNLRAIYNDVDVLDEDLPDGEKPAKYTRQDKILRAPLKTVLERQERRLAELQYRIDKIEGTESKVEKTRRDVLNGLEEDNEAIAAEIEELKVEAEDLISQLEDPDLPNFHQIQGKLQGVRRRLSTLGENAGLDIEFSDGSEDPDIARHLEKYGDEIPELRVLDFGRQERLQRRPLPPHVVFDVRITPPGGMQDDLGDAIAGAFAAHSALPESQKKEFFVYGTPDGQFFYSDLHPFYYDQARGGERRDQIEKEVGALQRQLQEMPSPTEIQLREKQTRQDAKDVIADAEAAAKTSGRASYVYRDSKGQYVVRGESVDDDSLTLVGKTDDVGSFRISESEKLREEFSRVANQIEDLRREREDMLSSRARVLIMVDGDHHAMVYGLSNASRKANSIIINNAGSLNREERKRDIIAEMREGIPDELKLWDVRLENWVPREITADEDAREPIRDAVRRAKELLHNADENPTKQQVNVYRNSDGSFDIEAGRSNPDRQRVARIWDPKNDRGPQVQWVDKRSQQLHDAEADPRDIVPSRGGMHTRPGNSGYPGLSDNPAEDIALHERQIAHIRKQMKAVRVERPPSVRDRLLAEMSQDIRHHYAQIEEIEKMIGDRDLFETDREKFEREHAISSKIRDTIEQAKTRQKESKKTIQIYLNDDGELEISERRYDPERNRIARITSGGKAGIPVVHWDKDEYEEIYKEAEFTLPTLIKQYFDVDQVDGGLDFRGKFIVRNFADAQNDDRPGNMRNIDHPVYSLRQKDDGWLLLLAAEGEGVSVNFGTFATPEAAQRAMLTIEREAVALSGNRAFRIPDDNEDATWFVRDNRLHARPTKEGFRGTLAITRSVSEEILEGGKLRQVARWIVARHGQGLDPNGVEFSGHKTLEEAKANIDERIRTGIIPDSKISWQMDGDRMVGNSEYDGQMAEYVITRDENGIFVYNDKGYLTPEEAQSAAEAREFYRRAFLDSLRDNEIPPQIVGTPGPVLVDKPFLLSSRIEARDKPNTDGEAKRPQGITEMMNTAPTKTRATRQSKAGASGNAEKARLGIKQGFNQNDILPEGTDEFYEALQGGSWSDLQELLEGRRDGITTVYWDIETTGLKNGFPGQKGTLARPIQISGVAMRDGKPVGKPFTRWMNPNQKVGAWSAGKEKPGQGVPLSKEDQKKYGSEYVTDQFIEDQPPMQEQMGEFLDWLSGLGPTAMVAQNGQGMEIPLIRLLQEQGLLERGLPDNVVGHVDTIGVLREATADLSNADVPMGGNNRRVYSQQAWAKRFSLDNPDTAHDAEADASTLMAIMNNVVGGAVSRGLSAPIEFSPAHMSAKRRIKQLADSDEEITPEAVDASLTDLSVGDILPGTDRRIVGIEQGPDGETLFELERKTSSTPTPKTSKASTSKHAASVQEMLDRRYGSQNQKAESVQVDDKGNTVIELESKTRRSEPKSRGATVDREKLERDYDRVLAERNKAEEEGNLGKVEDLQKQLDDIANKLVFSVSNQEKRGEGDLAPGEGVGRVGGRYRMEIPDLDSPDVAQQAIENAEGSVPLNSPDREGEAPEPDIDPDGVWSASAALDAEDGSELVELPEDLDTENGFPMLGAVGGDTRAALERSPVLAARIDVLDKVANAQLYGFEQVDGDSLNASIKNLLENGRYGDEINLAGILNFDDFIDVKGAVLRKDNGYVSLILTRANGTKITEHTKQRPSSNSYYPWLQRAVAYHGNAEIPRGLSIDDLPKVKEDIESGTGVDGPAAHFLADMGFKVREALNRRLGIPPSPNESDGFIALRRDRPDLPGFTDVDKDGIAHTSMHADALREGGMHPVEIAVHEQLHGVSEAIHNPREVINEGLLGYEEGLVQGYTQHVLAHVGESVGFEGLTPSGDNPYWPWSEAYEKIRNSLNMSPDDFYGGLLRVHPRDRQAKMREWAETEVVNNRLRKKASEAIDEADVILRSMDLRAVVEFERANPNRPRPVLSPNARIMPDSPLPHDKAAPDWRQGGSDPVEQFWRDVADEAAAERESQFKADINAGKRPDPVEKPENPVIPGEDPGRRARRGVVLERWPVLWGPKKDKDGFAMRASDPSDLPEYPENRHFANSGDMAKHVILSELLGDDAVMRFMEAVPWANHYGPERFGSRARTRDDVWDFRSHAMGSSVLSNSAYNRALNDVIGTEDKPGYFPGSGMLADMLLPRNAAIISPPHDEDGYGLEWAYAAAGKGDFVLIDPMLPRQRSGKRKLHAFDVFSETTRRDAKSMLWTAMLENDSEGERLREEAEQAGNTWTAEIKFKQAVSGMNGMHIVVSNASPEEMDRLDAAMREYIRGFSNGDLNLRRHKKKPDVDVGNLTNPADVSTNSLSDRDREVVDHIQTLHRSVDPDDPGFGDINMTSLAKREGKDGVPDVVDDAEIDQRIAEGEIEVWRGVSKAQWADQFESGEYAAGLGPVVNGYYTSTRAGTAANHMGLPSSDQGTPEDIAKREGVMQRMTIKKDARVLELGDYDAARLAESDPELLGFYDNVRSVQKTRLRLLTRELDEWRGANPPPSDPEELREYIDNFWKFAHSREEEYKLAELATLTSMDTPHIFGLLHGYDAVYFRAPNPGKPAFNWVILNRAATRISRTRYTAPEPVSEIRKHKDDIKVTPID